MSVRERWIFWGGVFLALAGVLVLFKSVLLPFVLGGAIAYLLNPLLEKLTCFRVRREMGIALVLGGFLVTVAVCLAILVPVLVGQLIEFTKDMPLYYHRLQALVQSLAQTAGQTWDVGALDLKGMLESHAQSIAPVVQSFLYTVFIGGQGIFSVLSLVIFTPMAAYYFMRDWAAVCRGAQEMLPLRVRGTVLALLREMDVKISAFVRGQITVAFVLGLFYALALGLLGLKHGILIGLSAGMMSVVPFVGPVVGIVLGIGVAWFDGGNLLYLLSIAGVFALGQIIEGNVLTPKLVGEAVGLHPLWLFFALMAGGSLFGFLGVFLAVPTAAVISVLVTFGIKQYKASRYYGAA